MSYQCHPRRCVAVAVPVAEYCDILDRREASFCAKTELIEAILTLKLIEANAAEFDFRAELIDASFTE